MVCFLLYILSKLSGILEAIFSKQYGNKYPSPTYLIVLFSWEVSKKTHHQTFALDSSLKFLSRSDIQTRAFLESQVTETFLVLSFTLDYNTYTHARDSRLLSSLNQDSYNCLSNTLLQKHVLKHGLLVWVSLCLLDILLIRIGFSLDLKMSETISRKRGGKKKSLGRAGKIVLNKPTSITYFFIFIFFIYAHLFLF